MKTARALGLVCCVLVVATAPALAVRPVTVSPGNPTGVDEIPGSCPTFSWETVPGAEVLDLVVYRVPGGGPDAELAGPPAPVVERRLPGGATTWTPSLAHCLEPGGHYAWSLRATGVESVSEWAAPSLFRVAKGPAIEEVEAALRVLRRYVRETPSGPGAPSPELPAPLEGRPASESDATADSAPPELKEAGFVAEFKVTGTAEADVVRLGDTGGNFVFWEMQEELNNDMTIKYGAELMRISLVGDVGIGTTTPGSKLDVNGTATVTGFELPTGAGDGLVLTSDASGVGSWQAVAGGADSDWAIDGVDMSSGVAGNVGIGTMSAPVQKLQVVGTAQTDTLRLGDTGGNGIFWDLAEDVGQDLVFTYGAERLRVHSNGRLDIGALAPASGTDLCINAQNELASCSSSLRYKEDVRELTAGSEVIARLRPVDFKWRDRDERDLGFVAEEVAAIDPLLVTYMDGRIEGVKYRQLTAVLVRALQEQELRIQELERQLGGESGL